MHYALCNNQTKLFDPTDVFVAANFLSDQFEPLFTSSLQPFSASALQNRVHFDSMFILHQRAVLVVFDYQYLRVSAVKVKSKEH